MVLVLVLVGLAIAALFTLVVYRRARGTGAELVSLGPLTRDILDGAELRDAFPSSQAWADDTERILEFLRCAGAVD